MKLDGCKGGDSAPLVAFHIDGLLCNTEAARKDWDKFTGAKPINETFYAGIQPYDDVGRFAEWLDGCNFVVLTERHSSVSLATRAWLRSKCGISVSKENIVFQSVLRYDVRLLGVKLFIAGTQEVADMMSIETVHKFDIINVNRPKGSLEDIWGDK